MVLVDDDENEKVIHYSGAFAEPIQERTSELKPCMRSLATKILARPTKSKVRNEPLKAMAVFMEAEGLPVSAHCQVHLNATGARTKSSVLRSFRSLVMSVLTQISIRSSEEFVANDIALIEEQKPE